MQSRASVADPLGMKVSHNFDVNHACRLKTPHNPRPPYPKFLEMLSHLLMALQVTLSFILSPIGFTMQYDTDSREANFHGRKILLTAFWVRPSQSCASK